MFCSVPKIGIFSLPKGGSAGSAKGEWEIKYHVPVECSPALEGWLGLMLRPHPVYPVGEVCSVYFDTEQLDSFSEKADSFYVKTKYRVRWYSDADGLPLPGPAFLETKAKEGAVRRKQRTALPVPAAELAAMPLDDPAWAELVHRHLVRRSGPVDWLRPVLELRYRRRRYGHPAFAESFCLDSRIRCTRTHALVLPPATGQELGYDIFEQKGDSTDPLPLLRALPRFDARRASLSKYFLAILQIAPHLDS